MKIKKEYLVLAIVIVALVLYLALGTGSQPGADLPKISVLDKATINRVVISKKGSTFELVKKDERWFILPNNYPADPYKIKNMVKAATELTVTALVSESGNYERYDLDDTKQVQVQVHSDGQLQREFAIGRSAPTFQHTFARLAKDPNVYHARGSLKTTFDHTIEDLRDKTVLSFEKETIASLQIQKGDQDLTLTKTETEVDQAPKDEGENTPSTPVTKTLWQTADGETLDNATIKALLDAISGLKCESYMADDAKTSLEGAVWTVTAKDAGSEYALSVFSSKEKEAAQIPGTSSSNDFAFLLAKNRVETIAKHIDKLLDPTPEK